MVGFLSVILFGFLSFGALQVNECEPDFGNLIPNTCRCQTLDTESGMNGFLLRNCDEIACEQFRSHAIPDGCKPGMRGVSCLLKRDFLFCSLNYPRVESSVDAEKLCQKKFSELKTLGYQSEAYSQLDRPFCRPSGHAWTPIDRWNLILVEEDWSN